MLLEPGELHVTTRIRGLASFQTFFIEPEQFIHWARERGLSSTPHFTKARVSSPAIFSAFAALRQSLSHSSSALTIETRWLQCLELLFEGAVEQKKPALARMDLRKLELAKDYLTAHHNTKITLDELASLTGVSRFHFIREFKRVYGIPPHAFLIELRLSQIRKALRDGTPLREIDSGFFDDSHVHYHFKRSVGMPPKAYARSVSGSSV